MEVAGFAHGFSGAARGWQHVERKHFGRAQRRGL